MSTDKNEDAGRQASNIHKDEILEALSWLMETIPREPQFTELVTEGARGDETYTMKLDGDDLASFCHSINVLHTYFGYDRSKRYTYWDQELLNFVEPKDQV